MTSTAHAEAVKTLIAPTVPRLFEGEAPAGAEPPYAVLYMGDGQAVRGRLAPRSDRIDASFQVTSVGLDPVGTRSVADRVRAAVLDQRPAVAGRASSPVQQDVAQPLRVDRDVDPHVLMVVNVYSFFTVPAPA